MDNCWPRSQSFPRRNFKMAAVQTSSLSFKTSLRQGHGFLRTIHKQKRCQFRWHWCGRHAGKGKLVSTRSYLQILGTSTDYSSPSFLLFTDSYRFNSVFVMLFLGFYCSWIGCIKKTSFHIVCWALKRSNPMLCSIIILRTLLGLSNCSRHHGHCWFFKWLVCRNIYIGPQTLWIGNVNKWIDQ